MKKISFKFTLILLIVLTVVCGVIALGVGRFYVAPSDVLRVIVGFLGAQPDVAANVQNIIENIRIPRIIAAILVGAALSISGAAYQGVFRNQLVSPDLLGVSAGACVGAAVAIMFDLSLFWVQALAFVSGLAAVGMTLSIPRLMGRSSTLMLVLSGVIMSGFMSALLGIAKYVADPENHLASIVYWTMGSFSNVRMKDVLLISPPILAAMAVLLLLRWRVNLLSLGDAEAGSLGVNVRRARGVTILCSTVLTACAVCLCGTIGWAGLIVPHLGRLIVGQDNRYLLPMSAVLGALFLVVVDTLARNLTGSEIPLSIITGVLGAPLFVWLLARQRARIGDDR